MTSIKNPTTVSEPLTRELFRLLECNVDGLRHHGICIASKHKEILSIPSWQIKGTPYRLVDHEQPWEKIGEWIADTLHNHFGFTVHHPTILTFMAALTPHSWQMLGSVKDSEFYFATTENLVNQNSFRFLCKRAFPNDSVYETIVTLTEVPNVEPTAVSLEGKCRVFLPFDGTNVVFRHHGVEVNLPEIEYSYTTENSPPEYSVQLISVERIDSSVVCVHTLINCGMRTYPHEIWLRFTGEGAEVTVESRQTYVTLEDKFVPPNKRTCIFAAAFTFASNVEMHSLCFKLVDWS